jgi:hypothetical protein
VFAVARLQPDAGLIAVREFDPGLLKSALYRTGVESPRVPMFCDAQSKRLNLSATSVCH